LNPDGNNLQGKRNFRDGTASYAAFVADASQPAGIAISLAAGHVVRVRSQR